MQKLTAEQKQDRAWDRRFCIFIGIIIGFGTGLIF